MLFDLINSVYKNNSHDRINMQEDQTKLQINVTSILESYDVNELFVKNNKNNGNLTCFDTNTHWSAITD